MTALFNINFVELIIIYCYQQTLKTDYSKLIESNLADYKTFIKKGANTTFFIPSTDEVTSKKFMNTLISVTNNVTGTITVFGTKDWLFQ